MNEQTSKSNLPAFPEPWIVDGSTKDPSARHHYAEDQMVDRDNEVLEAAAVACEAHRFFHSIENCTDLQHDAGISQAAASIRALKHVVVAS